MTLRLSIILLGLVWYIVHYTDVRHARMAGTPIQMEQIVHVYTSKGRCSGFIVGKGLIATAGHCIRFIDKNQLVQFSDGTFVPYQALVVDFKQDCITDWALIMADTGKRSSFDFGTVPKTDMPAWRVGYPGGDDVQKAKTGKILSTYPYIVMSNEAIHGESGSPVLDLNGKVFGILVCVDHEYDGADIADIGELRRILRMVGRVK